MARHVAVRQMLVRLPVLTMLLLAAGIYAGDEDMSPSAYHVFDPETGYMMTVDPMSEDQMQAAAAAASIDNVDAAAATANGNADDAVPSRPLLLIAAVLLLGGGLIAWKRKRAASA